MENQKEKEVKKQGFNNDILGAILFTIIAFILMYILSRYIG